MVTSSATTQFSSWPAEMVLIEKLTLLWSYLAGRATLPSPKQHGTYTRFEALRCFSGPGAPCASDEAQANWEMLARPTAFGLSGEFLRATTLLPGAAWGVQSFEVDQWAHQTDTHWPSEGNSENRKRHELPVRKMQLNTFYRRRDIFTWDTWINNGG